jgi:hypothetical protein
VPPALYAAFINLRISGDRSSHALYRVSRGRGAFAGGEIREEIHDHAIRLKCVGRSNASSLMRPTRKVNNWPAMGSAFPQDAAIEVF